MSLHRCYCNPLIEPTTELAGAEARHLGSVLRLRVGAKVELFDGAGSLASAVVSAVKKNKVALDIEHVERNEPPKSRRIIIAVSVPKGRRFDWLIEKCTELGVDRICPVIFERTVKQPANPKTLKRWKNLAISAAKQCRRLFLPVIDAPMLLAEAIGVIKGEYPGCGILLGSLSGDVAGLIGRDFGSKDTAVFIGPEGGLTEKEEQILNKAGAQSVYLTETILRVETAAIAFAAVLAAQHDTAEF